MQRLRLPLLFGLAAVPLIFALLFNDLSLRASQERISQHTALAEAKQAALELERLISGTTGLLQAIVNTDVVRLHDIRGCRAYLGRLKPDLPQYLSLGIVDLDGNILCRHDDAVGPNLADRPYFIEALATPEKVIVSEYTVSRISGAATLPISLAFTDDTGKVQGVAVASLDLAWLDRILRQRELAPGASLTVADKKGTIIARLPLADQFVGTRIPDGYMRLVTAAEPGVEAVVSQDGTSRFLGYVPAAQAPGSGLYVSAGVAVASAFEELDEARMRTIVLILVAVLLAAGGALVMAQKDENNSRS